MPVKHEERSQRRSDHAIMQGRWDCIEQVQYCHSQSLWSATEGAEE